MTFLPIVGRELRVVARKRSSFWIRVAAALVVCCTSQVLAQQTANAATGSKAVTSAAPAPVTWRDPGDIAARDLRFGPGSEKNAPVGPFTFLEEDAAGESPKFKVRDAQGVIWSVKMGVEAQAETVVSRLVWAVGYFAEEAYYLDRIEVKNLPKLRRGGEFVENKTTVRGVRLEPRRDYITRGETWDWEQNPFVGTRELNGLKVLMVLVANYDTSVRNNSIFTVRDPETGNVETRYIVSDVGCTLGKIGGMGGKRSKNNLSDFLANKFILSVENGVVKFDYDTTPKGAGGFFAKMFSPGYGSRQAKKERAMGTAPVADARWIGTQLAKLSDEQLRDAFRAAHYDQATMEGFVKVLRERINQLAKL